jgi:CheY-like chemotaxis protein
MRFLMRVTLWSPDSVDITDEAESGEDALAAWDELRHDVVVLDMKMPGMSGLDVARMMLKEDLDVGEFRWLTVTSPEGAEGMELLLEPDAHPAAKAFKQALVDDGIPTTSFGVDDLDAEVARLQDNGVRFILEPVNHGPVSTAVFDDTCGNLIQLAQRH